jgi:hypothetical protein
MSIWKVFEIVGLAVACFINARETAREWRRWRQSERSDSRTVIRWKIQQPAAPGTLRGPSVSADDLFWSEKQ